ncbi:TIGR03086 family metal-binding protein [Nocardioides sp.]|uniref:TIGR03086 family metal-binding protein n=1 Tax=Nocardioides sp. TaxID=35761 RepID=UPI003D0AC1D2
MAGPPGTRLEALPPAVSLLERSIGFTRVALMDVTADSLRNPTPCRAWDLAQLLAHMDDALDAFAQAGSGAVDLVPLRSSPQVLERIRGKACALLAAWSQADPAAILIGDRELPAAVLVRAGALEIAVHGWDVGQATGHPRDLPEDLARHLLPIATDLVEDADRPHRFGPRVAVAEGRGPQFSASYGAELLGFLGRFA